MARIEFKKPDALELPEGTEEGDKVEFMAEFEVKGDGRLCLVSIEGNKMAGYKEDSDSSPHKNEFIDRYRSEMSRE